jgi:DNA-binding LytR/AlgR family response regulator
MKVAICDDLEVDRQHILNLLHQFSKEESMTFETYQFVNGEALLASLKNHHFDIVFLDIYMTGNKGIDIAKNIKKMYPEIIIIFTTTSKEFAIESYSLNIEGYIVKPISYEQFHSTLKKHCNKFKESLAYITVVKDKVPIEIYLNTISYIEIYSRQCVLHTTNGNIDTKTPINSIADYLLENNFFRVGRSCIINFKFVRDFKTSYFLMNSGEKIPVSLRNRSICKEAFYEYFWNDTRN